MQRLFSAAMLGAGRRARAVRAGAGLGQARRSISKRVFVRGFPDNVTKEQIEKCMSSYGKIVQLNVFESPSVRATAALVTFENINSAFSAIDELQHALVFGRRISIDFALTNATTGQQQRWKSEKAQQAGAGEGEQA